MSRQHVVYKMCRDCLLIVPKFNEEMLATVVQGDAEVVIMLHSQERFDGTKHIDLPPTRVRRIVEDAFMGRVAPDNSHIEGPDDECAPEPYYPRSEP